jgi:uncharacterized protein DUF4259
MGAWGAGSFENDDAADWITELGSMAPDDLAQLFAQAADDPSYLEAPAASVVVAAAEVICRSEELPCSRSAGRDCQMGGESTGCHRRTQGSDTPSLGPCAEKTSELKDLWLEADGLNDWTAAMDLQVRVGR